MQECLRFKRISDHASAPVRATPNSAGYDLTSTETIFISPGGRGVIPTGLILEIPDGHYGRVAPRSGLAIEYGINVGGGVIDADYRGEVKVILFNHGADGF